MNDQSQSCSHPNWQVSVTWTVLGQLARREVQCPDCGEKWEEVPKKITVTWQRKESNNNNFTIFDYD